MSLTRRELLSLTGGAVIAGALAPLMTARAGAGSRYRAIVFDGFPIFDPRPVAALAEKLFPGESAKLMNVWRSRQFEYQWLRALAGQYRDFRQATEDSLIFAARQTGLRLTPEARNTLMEAYSHLSVWADVPAALRSLRNSGFRLGILSNMTENMLESGLASAHLDGIFERVLSTDRIKTYKPAPAAYQMAMNAFALPRHEILFVPFAGWDAAGAKWFGYPTFWMNRLDSPAEELSATPDDIGKDMEALIAFVQRESTHRESTVG
jgi:2-haloacid dehalogenase